MRVAGSLTAGLCLVCTLAAGLSGAALQAPPAAPNARPPLEFRAGTSVVLLDVVLRDKNGRPVRDLRPSELQVFENGQACEVRWFRRVDASASATGLPSPASPAAAAQPEPGAGTTAERVAPGVTLVSLVFDALAVEDAATAAKAANDFVERFLGPSPTGREQVAVFRLSHTLQVLQPFTPDKEAARRAIVAATSSRDPRERAHTRDAIQAARDADQAANQGLPAVPQETGDASEPSRNRVVPDPADARFREVIARALRITDDLQRLAQGNDTLRPLIALASAQATLPGRKAMLLLSPGLSIPGPLEDVYHSLVSAANRANVTVYSVDVRGLSRRPDIELAGMAVRQAATESMLQQQASMLNQHGNAGAVSLRQVQSLDRAEDGLRLNAQQTLSDLAEQTGGFLLANMNDYGAALGRVVDDMSAYYELAYAPARADFDGAFRKIEVRVARKDVVVLSRSGYFARPLPDEAAQPYEIPLLAALSEPLAAAAGGPSHRAVALRLADAGPFPEVLLLVDVPQSGLTLTAREGESPARYHGRVALVGVVRDERGLVLARLSHEAALDGPAAALESVRQQSLVVDRAIRLPAGRYVFETAVQDGPSGRIGRRRTAFEVPEPAAGPALGSLAVVQSERTRSSTRRLPLRAGDIGALPVFGRAFPEHTAAISLFLTAHAGDATPLQLSLEFRRDGQIVAQSTPDLPAADAYGRVSYVGTFPSTSLVPGRYEVWARLRQGDREATDATSFVIAPAADAASSASVSTTPRERTLRDIASPAVSLATILDRAGAYVARYSETFRNVIAEELYRQWLVQAADGRTTPRTLRSELVFVEVPGSLPWGSFRDVVELDGHVLKDRQGRLEKLFMRPDPDTAHKAREILKEGSRYNLGVSYRNVNSPTLAMQLLLPDNQRRLELERKGERTIGGFRCTEVEFREVASPTFIRDQWNNDVLSRGRFWIDGTRGTVLRTEIEYDLAANSAEDPEDRKTGSVATEYRLEPGLDLLVPDSMKELYRLGPTRIEATARYSKYRRFEVTTDWTVAKAPK